MDRKQELEKQLQRWKNFDDPALLMIIFLTLPAVIMATMLSTLGSGTLIKIAIASCFLFFTWFAFKINAVIKQQIAVLQAELKKQE